MGTWHQSRHPRPASRSPERGRRPRRAAAPTGAGIGGCPRHVWDPRCPGGAAVPRSAFCPGGAVEASLPSPPRAELSPHRPTACPAVHLLFLLSPNNTSSGVPTCGAEPAPAVPSRPLPQGRALPALCPGDARCGRSQAEACCGHLPMNTSPPSPSEATGGSGRWRPRDPD